MYIFTSLMFAIIISDVHNGYDACQFPIDLNLEINAP